MVAELLHRKGKFQTPEEVVECFTRAMQRQSWCIDAQQCEGQAKNIWRSCKVARYHGTVRALPWHRALMTRTSKRAIGIRRYLKSALKERVHKRGEELLVEQMTHVVNYGDWLNAAGVEAYNSFVPRRGSTIEVPHSFSFKLRRDLTGKE